nr:recombinase family protein [Candidatus Njordarchaeota archaeon]
MVRCARVSSSTQKDDLRRQKQLLLVNQANKEKNYYGDAEIQILTDTGSGLNEKGKNFLKLLHLILERRVFRVLVACEDQLTRFGFATLQEISSAFGKQIEAISREVKTPQEEFVEDIIAIVSHLAGRTTVFSPVDFISPQ